MVSRFLRAGKCGFVRRLGSTRTCGAACSHSFLQSDVTRPLLSVGKLTKSGAEVNFGSQGTWIDLHTDSGLQRVLVRVKGTLSASPFAKPAPGSSPKQTTPHAEVEPVDEEIGGKEDPNQPPGGSGSVEGRGDSCETGERRLAHPV